MVSPLQHDTEALGELAPASFPAPLLPNFSLTLCPPRNTLHLLTASEIGCHYAPRFVAEDTEPSRLSQQEQGHAHITQSLYSVSRTRGHSRVQNLDPPPRPHAFLPVLISVQLYGSLCPRVFNARPPQSVCHGLDSRSPVTWQRSKHSSKYDHE